MCSAPVRYLLRGEGWEKVGVFLLGAYSLDHC